MGLTDTVFDDAVFDEDCFDGNQARAGQITVDSTIEGALVLDGTIPAAAAEIILDSTISDLTFDSTIEE